MDRRLVALVMAVAAATASVAQAQGPTIEHTPIACIVAGHYPKMNACFSPAAEIARARVYFKTPKGPHWYWVKWDPAAPCFTATLLKPSKATTEMLYYVEVQDKDYREGKSDEYLVRVVKNKSCLLYTSPSPRDS